MKYRILIVDDDKDNLDSTRMLLEIHGYEVKTVTSGKQAIELFQKNKIEFALVLMDYHMPEKNGAAVISEIKRIKPNQQIVTYTTDSTKETALETIRAGAIDFIEKSADNDILLGAVKNYCEKYEKVFRTISADYVGSDEIYNNNAKHGLIGKSKALTKVVKEIELFAKTTTNVLIYGETGTGKELIARAIHNTSDRSGMKFIAVNCSAIPQGLVESTLFGHTKGSFTGAANDQDGKFKLANGGTIFLDEIGELPLDTQAKLLRVLQERVIDPVGSRSGTKIDVRVVAATHKNLEKMVEEGKFREDLLYRLNTVVIQNPPLRDRTEDIEILIDYFTKKICGKIGIVKRFQRSVLNQLLTYQWPGNIRELENMVESHLLRSPDSIIGIDQLDSKFFAKDKAVGKSKTLKQIEEDLELIKLNHILMVVTNSSSKIEAAKKLEISPTNLQYFLSKLNKFNDKKEVNLIALGSHVQT